MLIIEINELVVFHLPMTNESVLKLGANMHYINNEYWLNNWDEAEDTAKYSHHNVLIISMPNQEDPLASNWSTESRQV